MAQTPDTKTAISDQIPQSGTERKAHAAANQTMAAENAANSSIQATARHSGEAAEQVGNEIGESIRRSGAAGAEATQFTTLVGTETARRGVDHLAEGQRALMADMAEHFETLTQQRAHAMQQSASDLNRFIVPPPAAGENLRDLQDGMSALVSGVIHSNIQMTRDLLQMANPAAVFGLQQRFMRDYMDALLQGSSAIIRTARQTADQTMRPLREGIEKRQRRGNGRQRMVSDVMSSDVRLVTPDETVQQATRMMRDEDVGTLPVGEGDRLIGIVTDRDVTLLRKANARTIEAVTEAIKQLLEEFNVEECINYFVNSGYRST